MQQRTHRVSIRLTDAEYDRLRDAADWRGVCLSDEARRCICDALDLKDDWVNEQGRRFDLEASGVKKRGLGM